MFTLRLEWSRNGTREHSMHQARKYLVQHSGEQDDRGFGSRTMITLDPGTDDQEELILDGSQVVYVMNEQGQTVDTIRNQPRRAARS